ncbi:hypothetical protein [Paraburkholderia nemoris]|uniref:hypothetical protein n=1 Tax=Paraburkholderia nemoris TaxID=2793076 RepID=UPI0038BA5CD2
MSRGERIGNFAVFALGVFTLTTTTLAVWQHFSPLPFGDSWDGAIGFYTRAIQDPWHAFFEQHNEHRLVFSRLIFYADVRFFGGRNVFSLIANLALAALLAMTFFRIAVHHCATLAREARLGLAGAVLVFAFSWAQKENFTWGFQSQWFAVYLFALLAFHALDRTAEALAQGERAKSHGWLAMALISATVAAYSMSSGVLVFPVLIAQAIYRRLRPRDLAAICAVTVAVWVAYFVGWHKSASSGDLTASLSEHPFATLQYMLLYLGAPAFNVRLGVTASYVAGVLALTALAANCINALKPGEGRPRGVSLLVFALFVTGNALLTASGRLWSGLETALVSRYTTASLMGWLAIGIFAVLNVEAGKQRRRVLFVAVLATLLVASGQRLTFRSDRDVSYARLVAGLALRAHVYDPDIIKAVYPFPDVLTQVAKLAETAQISIFAPDQPDYLAALKTVHTDIACDGSLDAISTTTTPGVYRATGWIYETARSHTPQAVVLTDAATHATLGTGVTGGERNDLRKTYGKNASYSGWTAFFKAPASGRIRINGQTAAGEYCALAADRPMGATPQDPAK